jgi:hypothetical protein
MSSNTSCSTSCPTANALTVAAETGVELDHPFYLLILGLDSHQFEISRILGMSNSTSRFTGSPTAKALTVAAINAPAIAGQ